MWELIWLITSCLAVYTYAKTRSSRVQLRRQAEQLAKLGYRIAQLEKRDTPQTPAPIPESPTPSESPAPSLAQPGQAEQDPVKTEVLAPEASPDSASARPLVPVPLPESPPAPKLSAEKMPKAAWTEKLGQLEKTLGLRWTTWIGGLVLFLGAGLLIKYAFEKSWLGPGYRVTLGCLAGLCIGAAGLRFIRRQMRALGQGLVGVGLAVLYASLYGAYGLYELLPQTIVFALMTGVTVAGMVVAVSFDALPIAFMAVLGGFITPIMLGSGQDSRDSLFAYLLLLDIGVLGVALFRHWRALDVLAFTGTSLMFGAWYITFHQADTYALAPTMAWLTAFYLVFLIEPFAYHLRLRTPIVGERFALAVTNAVGMFGWAYVLLHEQHPHILGTITLGMSAAYLVLGIWMRRMIKEDRRAIFGFASLFIAFLIIAVPIHLDMHAVTIAWAIKAPVLLFLAYKYAYLPMRCASVIPLALAYARLFLFHWPLHRTAFFPVFNAEFGTVVFLLLSGTAYAFIHRRYAQKGHVLDQVSRRWVGLGTAFLGLIMTHIEIWQWLDLSDRDSARFWASSLVWTAGALGFLYACLKKPSKHLFCSCLVALVPACVLYVCDLFNGSALPAWGLLHGRLLAAGLTSVMIFAAARLCRQLPELELKRQDEIWLGLYKLGVALTVALLSIETWLWLEPLEQLYAFRCTLPWLWTGGAVACLILAKRLPAPILERTTLIYLGTAAVFGLWQYSYSLQCAVWFVNARFITALWVCVLPFAYARRLPAQGQNKDLREGLFCLSILCLLVMSTLETWQWWTHRSLDYTARCLIPCIWILGSIGTLILSRRADFRRLHVMTLVLGAIAALYAASTYVHTQQQVNFLFLNGRCIVALAALALLFVYARIWPQGPVAKHQAQIMMGVCALALFLVLNVETVLFMKTHISDPAKSGWVTQMSLSLLWSLYAIAALFIGFWQRIRVLRLAALGLFGLTVLKVVLGDMAQVEEVYRIVSFIGLGLLMIGASYLYHRVEKKLQ